MSNKERRQAHRQEDERRFGYKTMVVDVPDTPIDIEIIAGYRVVEARVCGLMDPNIPEEIANDRGYFGSAIKDPRLGAAVDLIGREFMAWFDQKMSACWIAAGNGTILQRVWQCKVPVDLDKHCYATPMKDTTRDSCGAAVCAKPPFHSRENLPVHIQQHFARENLMEHLEAAIPEIQSVVRAGLSTPVIGDPVERLDRAISNAYATLANHPNLDLRSGHAEANLRAGRPLPAGVKLIYN